MQVFIRTLEGRLVALTVEGSNAVGSVVEAVVPAHSAARLAVAGTGVSIGDQQATLLQCGITDGTVLDVLANVCGGSEPEPATVDGPGVAAGAGGAGAGTDAAGDADGSVEAKDDVEPYDARYYAPDTCVVADYSDLPIGDAGCSNALETVAERAAAAADEVTGSEYELVVASHFCLASCAALGRGLATMPTTFTGSALVSTSIVETSLVGDDVFALVRGLRAGAPSLRKFSFSGFTNPDWNGEDGPEHLDGVGATFVTELLKMPSLRCLDVENAGDATGAAIATALASIDPACPLESLTLIHNEFTVNGGFKKLGQALITNSALRTLHLGQGRNMCPNAAEAIAVGLKHNKALAVLGLWMSERFCGGIKASGVEAIVEAIESNEDSALGSLVAFVSEGPDVSEVLQERLTTALKRNAALVSKGEAERPVYMRPEGPNSSLYYDCC